MSAAGTARPPALAKAAAAGDMVAALTTVIAPEGPAGPTMTATHELVEHPVPVRRSPGRPRGRRRMEPFSNKIEIGLRDDIDQYLSEHDETLVDLLDRALRAAIRQPPPQ